MNQQNEECFPRGGSKASKPGKPVQRNENLFSISEKTQKKAKTKKNKRKETKTKQIVVKNNRIYSSFVDILSYKKIQEDMLVLGCVHSVKQLSLQIELPGRTFGTVMVRSISNEFTQQLNKKIESDTISDETELVNLSKIFKLGQFVAVKVLSITQTEKDNKINLSMKPNDVNSRRNHCSFHKGMLIWASVVEKAEHCYILNVGVKNCRVILPFKKTEKEYDDGVPLWCVIFKCEILKEASILRVSTLEEDIAAQVEPIESSLDYIVPGSRLNFIYEKAIKGGLQGKILNDCISFVNETYFRIPFEKLTFSEGDCLKARVLYVQPTTKTTYLTLRSLETVAEPKLKNGDLIKATIEAKAGRGFVSKLEGDEKGFVSYRRVMKSLSDDMKSDLTNLINKKFSVGSSHKCRVLDYNYFDNMYMCTFETTIVKDKAFNMFDLKAGQIVKGKISDIKEAGVLIKIGHFHGFVPNLHLSNVQYSDNLKKKYSIGQQVTAKVLEINSEQVKLTLKQALIQSDKCLSNYEQVTINDQFPGVVVQVNNAGALVVFYDGIKGWIPRYDFAQKNICNIKEIFYIGQVINVTLVKFDKNETKLTLSVNPPKPPEKKMKIGDSVEGFVTEITDDGLILDIDGGRALLPKTHLHENVSLADAFLAQYTVGDKISKLLCVADRATPIVSLREANYYKNKRLPVLNNIREGNFLRCFHKSTSSNGILLYSPIRYLDKTIELHKTKKQMSSTSSFKLLPHQFLIGKVIRVTKKSIQVTAELSQVFDYNYEYSVDILEQYLLGVGELRRKLVKSKNAIAKVVIGSQVECVVEDVASKGGCSVVFNQNIRGIVDVINCPKKIKKGLQIKGVVLWIDYEGKYVEISLKPDHLGKINKTQDGTVGKSPKDQYLAEIVLVRGNFVEGILDKGAGNKQLVFLPIVLHHNDFSGKHSLHGNKGHEKIKIHICKTVEGKLIGMEKKILRNLQKQQQYHKSKMEAITLKRNEKRKLKTEKASQSKRMKLEENKEVTEDEGIDTRSDETDEISGKSGSEKEMNEMEEEFKKTEEDLNETEEESNETDEEANETDEEANEADEEANETEEESNETEEESNEIEDELSETEEMIETEEEMNETEEEDEIDDTEEEKSQDFNYEDDSDEHLNESKLNSSKHVLVTNKNRSTLHKNNKTAKTKIGNKQTKKRHQKEPMPVPNKKLKPDEEWNADHAPKPLLPGIKDFFADEPKTGVQTESSDDDETGDKQETKQKRKKKLSAAERATEIRLEEERLRKIEKELADSAALPQSADQFDRMLLGEPNNSELWARYIAFHAEATEIEKARAVARKALNAISITEIQDRLNVWIALLNLENLYGTPESYEKVFEEACRCNDSLTVYLESIRMLAELQKFKEMNEKIKKCRGKFKQIPQMWIDIGKVYYQIKQFEDARKLQASAVLTLIDKKTHVNVLVQFGIMEFNAGENSHAESLFETILQNYPGRVDVWCTYVDQLIKINKIELARKVLLRAVGQKLQFKKMQTLFKKYLWFEKKYGDDETVARVKQTISDFSKEIV